MLVKVVKAYSWFKDESVPRDCISENNKAMGTINKVYRDMNKEYV